MNLCLTLAEQSPAALQEKIARYQGQAAYLEIRLDYLEEPDPAALHRPGPSKWIATCRPLRAGGRWAGTEAARLRVLQEAARSGFDWVDVEDDVDEVPPFPSSTRMLRSFHQFDRFCPDLEGRFDSLQRLKGDAVKLAVAVNRTRELTALLGWMETLPSKGPFVILGMGELGQPSRFLGGLLGNLWTYVAEEAESNVAPGQFSLQHARDWYRWADWQAVPELYGVLGNPVGHSLSPLIHNRLFQTFKLQKLYLPIPLDEVDPWFEYVSGSRLPFGGFSVTLPFKTEVLKHVGQKRSPVDSLNTLVREDSGWIGLNTDYDGFLEPLTARLSLEGKRALVLGNGGVAHTVVRALLDRGARVTVMGRNAEKVARFAAGYGCSHALFSDLPLAADLCVNTTPVGQYPHPEDSPLSAEQLQFQLVYDLIYRPPTTRLLQLSAARGLGTISGMEMFVEQAARQFAAWTGLDSGKLRDLIGETVQGARL